MSNPFEDDRGALLEPERIKPGLGRYEPKPINPTPAQLAEYNARIASFETESDVDYDASELSICLRRLANPRYSTQGSRISSDRRAILYNWLVGVRTECDQCRRCVAWSSLAMRYFDRFLEQLPTDTECPPHQLVALACLSIASRMCDFGQPADQSGGRPSSLNFKPTKKDPYHSSVTAYAFDHDQIQQMEWQLVFTLGFLLNDVTPIQLIYLPEVIVTLNSVALVCIEFMIDLFTSHRRYPEFGAGTVANALLLYLYGIELCDEDSIKVLPATPRDTECLSVLWHVFNPRPEAVNEDFLLAYHVDHVMELLDVLSADQSRGYLASAAFDGASSFSPPVIAVAVAPSKKRHVRSSPQSATFLARQEAFERIWQREIQTGGSEFQGPNRPALHETAPRYKRARRIEDSSSECQFIEFNFSIAVDFESPSPALLSTPPIAASPDVSLGTAVSSGDRRTDNVCVGNSETGLAPMCE